MVSSAPKPGNRVDRKTRKNVMDWLRVEQVNWAGRLSYEVFLDRVVDLDTLPSTDDRLATARQDILQHTEFNNDWPDQDWVYSYKPLSLISSSDDTFLAFLTEMIHPVVRPDSDEARRLAGELNDLLRSSDLELYESGSIGTRPTWSARFRSSGAARPATAPSTPPAIDGIKRLWGDAGFRLFLSHTSANKVAVARLKQALQLLGIAAFVAHEDIEPTLEWQVEIDTALRTMDAMAAVLTQDFHASNWTDQEVGFALGQGIVVVGVEVPATPYGFMGKHQGLPGRLDAPASLAEAIVRGLLIRSETSTKMREALVVGLEDSTSFEMTKRLVSVITSIEGFSEDQLSRMEAAIGSNDQVTNYWQVGRLRAFLTSQTRRTK